MNNVTKRWLVAVAVVVSVVAAGCGSSSSSDGRRTSTTRSGSTSTSTSTSGASTTSAPPVTTTVVTTTTEAGSGQPETALWPVAASATRYADPVSAARGFAVSYLGFLDPVMGTFRQGDSRSGEVDVRPSATGPITTVLVRQVTSADTWWVLGAGAADIVIAEPTASATITSPVRVTGQSTAFEATVNLEVRQDGTAAPIAVGTAMGGANGQMGPFAATVTFPAATAPRGAIVVKALSAKDGSTLEASVLRVAF